VRVRCSERPTRTAPPKPFGPSIWSRPGRSQRRASTSPSSRTSLTGWARPETTRRASSSTVAAHFEGRPQQESFVRYGLYLTGARDEKILPEKAPDLEALCAIGWIHGLRAASEGPFQESRLWLQTALETNRVGLPPSAYAQDILSRWWKADKSLAALEAEGTF
jgi:hypothetical protein